MLIAGRDSDVDARAIHLLGEVGLAPLRVYGGQVVVKAHVVGVALAQLGEGGRGPVEVAVLAVLLREREEEESIAGLLAEERFESGAAVGHAGQSRVGRPG